MVAQRPHPLHRIAIGASETGLIPAKSGQPIDQRAYMRRCVVFKSPDCMETDALIIR